MDFGRGVLDGPGENRGCPNLRTLCDGMSRALGVSVVSTPGVSLEVLEVASLDKIVYSFPSLGGSSPLATPLKGSG